MPDVKLNTTGVDLSVFNSESTPSLNTEGVDLSVFESVKKKEEPVSFGGSESLASPSAATEDKQPLTYMQQQLRDKGLIVDAPTTKELKSPPSGSETLKALKSSSARALGGIVGLPNFLNDQLDHFVVKPILKGVGYSDEEADAFVAVVNTTPIQGGISPLQSNQGQQSLNKYASSIESTMKQYEEGIIGSLKNNNYGDAGAQLWKGAVQSLPYLAMTLATSGGGTPAVLSTIGTTAAAQRYGELTDPKSEDGKNLSETGKFINSWAYGGMEAAGELITAGLLNSAKKAIGQIGKEAIDEVGSGFVKQALKSFGLEGSSEGATELGQQVTDYLQGTRENIDLKAVGDAVLVGGVTGAGIGGTTATANKASKMLAGRKVASDEDVAKVNENNSKIVDLLAEKQKAETPEASAIIDTELTNVTKENKDIIEANEKKAEKLAPEEIVKLKDLDDAIDSYDARIESPSETDNPELLKQIKEKLVLDKQKLVEQATTKKQEPVVVEEPTMSEEEDLRIKEFGRSVEEDQSKYVNKISSNKFEATNPFTEEKTIFNRKEDAAQYVFDLATKARTKNGRMELLQQKPTEVISEPVEPRSVEEATIAPSETKEGLKQQKEVVVEPEVSFPKPPSPVQKLSSKEIRKFSDDIKTFEDNLVDTVFGENAAEYKRLERISNSSTRPYDQVKEADDVMEAMIASLPKSKQDLWNSEATHDWRDLRETSRLVEYVEQAEGIEDLSSSLKKPLMTFKKDSNNEQSLAIFNAATKRAQELGISPKDLIAKTSSKIAREFKDPQDAMDVVKSALKAISQPTVAEQKQIEQKQPIVGEQQIEVKQTKKETDEKETNDAPKGQGRKEKLLEKNKKADDLLAEGLSDIADLLGTKLSLTGEQRVKVKDAVRKVAKGMILKGEVKVEQLAIAIKDYFSKAGHDISDELINEALKEEQDANQVRKGNKGDIGAQKGVVEGTKGKVPLGNDGKDQKTPRGEGEVTTEQKISQHYKKLIDPKSGVSKETRDILLNKDGKYDVVTKAQLNKFADEVIGSVLIDGEGGLDVILADLKSNDSKLIPSDLNGANVVLSYKLAYQYERLGAFDKATDVDIWRKKFGTQIGQMLSAFDEMMEVPEQRIRRLRGEMKEDRDAKMDRKGTTGKLISEEISDIEDELNKVSMEALEKENEELKKKIEEVLSKKKGAVKAGATILTKDKAKQLADKIRSFRIRQDKLMSADPLTAAYVITRNGTLSLVAEVVEQTGNVTEAINKGLAVVRKSDWYQKLTNAERSVYENKYRGFLKDEFGLSNTYQLENIDIKDVEQNILDIVTEHWTKVKKQDKSLETKLIEAGLDIKSADDIANTAKELVYEYVKENGLTNIKKLFKEKPTTKSQAKIRETASQRVLNMIREGATQSDGLIDALADFYGYGKIGFDLLDRAIKIANESSALKAGIRKTILLEEFENIIYNLDHGTAKKVYDAINDLYNTSILSAPTTTSRAVKGMLLTGLAHGAVATIANPRAMVLGGMKYFARGTWNGLKMAPSAIKTGIGGLDVSDVPSNVSYIRSVVNKPLIQHLKEMYNTLPDKKGGKLAGKRFSKALELGTKITFHLPVKMYRSLLAIDAPLATGLTEMEAFIKAYNDSMATEKDLSMSDRLTKINERLGRDSKTINQIRQEVKGEIEDMKAKGEKIPPKYETIRELELVELMRDIELVEVSKRLSKQALLMNKPEGIFTGGMYSLLRNITSVKPEAMEIKDKETGKVKIKYKVSPQAAAAALALKFVFPIIRVPANFLRTVSGYTPIGLIRASMPTTGYLKGSDKATRIKSSDERIRQAVSGVVGTTIGFALASLLFDYDDEDKTLQLSEDSPLKVTFMGTGDNTKNKTISKNYKEISFSLRRPDWATKGNGKTVWDTTMGGEGEWSDPISYIDNPLGMILAPLGYVSDRMKYYKPKEDADGNIKPIWDGNFDLFMSIAWNSMAFGTSQSYMQGANDLLKLIPQNSKEMPSNFRMDAYNFFNRPITALFKPNLYQFMEKQLNAATGRPEKEYAGVLAGMARFIPTLEDEFNGERTDQFGYPVTREFMLPFIPDALTDIVEEWKDEKLRRGTNDWKLILSREKIVLPRSWKTDDTHYGKYSEEDRNQAQEQAKIYFRDKVLRNYERLQKMDDEDLQEKLNSYRERGYTNAKRWLGNQPTTK